MAAKKAQTVGRREALALALTALGCGRREVARPFACTDASALAPDEAASRTALAYTEPAPNRARSCSSCQQYLAPPDGQGCGSCRVLKGPVHPAGTCKAFAPAMM